MYSNPADDALLVAAVRAGMRLTGVVTATRGGTPLLTGPLRLITGQVTDTPGNASGAPGGGGVRRTLELEVEDATGELEDTLSPTGVVLQASTVVTLTDGQRIVRPHGVFDVDTATAGLGPGGGLKLTAVDKYARLQRAKFPAPVQPAFGMAATQQIADLVRGALGTSETVLNYSRSATTIPTSIVFSDDRAKAIEDLAVAAGVYVSFNRLGQCEIRDLPTLSSRADWLVDASPQGVFISGDRVRSRQKTANVVVVYPEQATADGPAWTPVTVWDSDPASPTYAGPDPVNRPDLAGPFGVVIYRYTSPLISDGHAALVAASSILATTTGLTVQLTGITASPHPGLDGYDVVDVLPPRRYGGAPILRQRIIADSVVHPLVPGAQQITGRSTRADSYS